MPEKRSLELPLLEAIYQRAAVEADFRAKLLVGPRAAIAEAFGAVLPEDLRIRFIERHPDVDLLIVLPDLVETPEVSDHNWLDSVSAGLQYRAVLLGRRQP